MCLGGSVSLSLSTSGDSLMKFLYGGESAVLYRWKAVAKVIPGQSLTSNSDRKTTSLDSEISLDV